MRMEEESGEEKDDRSERGILKSKKLNLVFMKRSRHQMLNWQRREEKKRGVNRAEPKRRKGSWLIYFLRKHGIGKELFGDK